MVEEIFLGIVTRGSNPMNNEKMARELVNLAKSLTGAWPSKVEKGGLRKALGLSEDKPLEEQTSPSTVISFFKKADAEGRGMVTFAMNSNKDSAFWKKVAEGIKSKKSSGRTAVTLEEKAKDVGSNKSKLLKRLKDAKSVLRKDLKRRFGKGKFDFSKKQMVSDDGTFLLQWKLRKDPKKPESSSNQQTAVGDVDVVWLKKSSKRTAASAFEKALTKAIRQAIMKAKRDGTTSMSLDSLMQMVRPPSSSLEGAPKGTNARYYYKEMFRDIAKRSRFVTSSEKVAGKLDVKKVSKIETQVRVDGKLKYTITKYGRDNYEVSGLGPKGTVRKYANYKGALKAIEKNEGIKASERVAIRGEYEYPEVRGWSKMETRGSVEYLVKRGGSFFSLTIDKNTGEADFSRDNTVLNVFRTNPDKVPRLLNQLKRTYASSGSKVANVRGKGFGVREVEQTVADFMKRRQTFCVINVKFDDGVTSKVSGNVARLGVWLKEGKEAGTIDSWELVDVSSDRNWARSQAEEV